jgi:hypothetical protein
MFVGDFNHGYLYHFDLNKKRTQLSLKGGPLEDKIANNIEETQRLIFGKDFGGITDIQVGPDDDYLYILSLYQGGGNCQIGKTVETNCINYSSPLEGTLFRIVPGESSS